MFSALLVCVQHCLWGVAGCFPGLYGYVGLILWWCLWICCSVDFRVCFGLGCVEVAASGFLDLVCG